MDNAVANTECRMCSTTRLQVHARRGVWGSVFVFCIVEVVWTAALAGVQVA
jgi:hypothetical protein